MYTVIKIVNGNTEALRSFKTLLEATDYVTELPNEEKTIFGNQSVLYKIEIIGETTEIKKDHLRSYT